MAPLRLVITLARRGRGPAPHGLACGFADDTGKPTAGMSQTWGDSDAGGAHGIADALRWGISKRAIM